MKGRGMNPVTSVKHPLRTYTERLHPIPFSGSRYMKGERFHSTAKQPVFLRIQVREQSNRPGTRLKTESETGERR